MWWYLQVFFPALLEHRWVCYVWCLCDNLILAFDPRCGFWSKVWCPSTYQHDWYSWTSMLHVEDIYAHFSCIHLSWLETWLDICCHATYILVWLCFSWVSNIIIYSIPVYTCFIAFVPYCNMCDSFDTLTGGTVLVLCVHFFVDVLMALISIRDSIR